MSFGGLIAASMSSGLQGAADSMGDKLRADAVAARALVLEEQRLKGNRETDRLNAERLDKLAVKRAATNQGYAVDTAKTLTEARATTASTLAGTNAAAEALKTPKTTAPKITMIEDELGVKHPYSLGTDGQLHKVQIAGSGSMSDVPQDVMSAADKYAESRISEQAGWTTNDETDFSDFGGSRTQAFEAYKQEYLKGNGYGSGLVGGQMTPQAAVDPVSAGSTVPVVAAKMTDFDVKVEAKQGGNNNQSQVVQSETPNNTVPKAEDQKNPTNTSPNDKKAVSSKGQNMNYLKREIPKVKGQIEETKANIVNLTAIIETYTGPMKERGNAALSRQKNTLEKLKAELKDLQARL